MPDLAQIKTAFSAWGAAAVGNLPAPLATTPVPLAFRDDDRSFELKLPWRVEFDGPSRIGGTGGWDVVQYTNAASDLVDVSVVAHRQASLFVRVVSRDNRGNAQAEMLLERLRVALKKPSTLKILQDAGIAVIQALPSAKYPQLFDQRNESVAAFELRFAFDFTDTSTSDGTSDTIGSIQLTSEASDVDGSVLPVPPNLDDYVVSEDEL